MRLDDKLRRAATMGKGAVLSPEDVAAVDGWLLALRRVETHSLHEPLPASSIARKALGRYRVTRAP